MNNINHSWERFTVRERLSRTIVYVISVITFVWSLKTVEIIPEFLYDAPEQMADLFTRMWPIDFAFYPIKVHDALIETVNIATLGTLTAILMSIPLAIMSASNIVKNPISHWAARFFLVSSRSVNSLIWALFFVAIFGPGVIAGVLAIGFRSIGFIGKLLGEALEEVNMGSVEALRSTGTSWPIIMIKAYWPQVKPAFVSIILFRWDINVRESAVLGMVGAGGIGVVINDSLNLFEWQRVSISLLTIFVLVILAEILVVSIRKRLI